MMRTKYGLVIQRNDIKAIKNYFNRLIEYEEKYHPRYPLGEYAKKFLQRMKEA